MGNGDYIACPFCGEMIRKDAIKCRYCGEFLEISKDLENSKSRISNNNDQTKMEGLLFKGPLSNLALIRPAILFTFWLVLSVVIIIYERSILSFVILFIPPSTSYLNYALKTIGIGIGFIALLWFIARVIIHQSHIFTVTNNRIEYETGVFSKRVENMDMWRVKDLSFHRSILQALLGIGMITIHSSDPSDPKIIFGPIRGARKLFNVLQRVQREADKRQAVVHIES